jgi:hypothetical protein
MQAGQQEQMQNVAAVAQSVIEATEPVQRRPTFAKSNAEWLEAVMKLNAAGAVNVSHSRVQLTRNAFYVIELTEMVCDTSYNKHGPLPLSAFFLIPIIFTRYQTRHCSMGD